MAAPDTDTSLDVPLVTSSSDHTSYSDDEPTNRRHWSGTPTTKKALSGLLVACMVFLLVGAGCGHQHHDHTAVETPSTLGETTYGVDVSWPIHHSIKRNADDGVFAKGSRHKAYLDHLKGCRNYYGKQSKQAARTCDAYEFDRILMNKRQPQSMENYTDVGFAKIKAPPRVAQLIQDFWDANKDNQIPEAWPEGNVYLNHWDSPSMMVSVDDTRLRGNGYSLKKQIWDAAQTTISAWTGGQDITPVSMYGVRVYTNNSVLVPHVDRLPLVASAMVNVAQDVEEDWPMELFDHNGQAHNVTLQPGEMLLFESHSVLHGRPFPLKGKYYAMLFIHFEPTGRNALKQRVGVDEQYRQAVQDGVGGQSSSEQNTMLPPYLRRFSPEEEHWQQENPNGWWQAPASAPQSYNVGVSKVQTAYAFQGDAKENQLSFEAGDIIKVDMSKTFGLWVWGTLLRTQQEGWFPQSYLVTGERSDAAKKTEQPQEHQAARDGDLEYWKDAVDNATPELEYKLINRRDANGWQPIHESAVNGKEAIVELLLEHGAFINARTNGGRGGTPLFLAQQALGADHPIVQYLVDRGALNIPPDNFRDEL